MSMIDDWVKVLADEIRSEIDRELVRSTIWNIKQSIPYTVHHTKTHAVMKINSPELKQEVFDNFGGWYSTINLDLEKDAEFILYTEMKYSK